jgi:ABC-2 type transport system ATP-binding protein
LLISIIASGVGPRRNHPQGWRAEKKEKTTMELTIEHLSKRYGQHWALRELSLRCEPGMLGLVGPNGAGKTTLMRMIATLLEPTEGTILWNGQDIRTHGEALRQVLGYLPQDFGIYPEFTGRQFLRYLAAMKGLPRSLAYRRVDEMLEIVQMEQAADRKLPTYSGGMKQRIGIAQALLNDPRLLIVDEPTAHLDPEERIRFRILLAQLAGDRTVLMSTHVVEDVAQTCRQVAVLAAGRLRFHGTVADLTATADGKVWSVVTAGPAPTTGTLVAAVPDTGGMRYRVLSPTRPGPAATPVPPTLEDGYLSLSTAS